MAAACETAGQTDPGNSLPPHNWWRTQPLGKLTVRATRAKSDALHTQADKLHLDALVYKTADVPNTIDPSRPIPVPMDDQNYYDDKRKDTPGAFY